MSRSFVGPEIFFVPYLTLTSTFIPNLTLPSVLLASPVSNHGPRCQIISFGSKLPSFLSRFSSLPGLPFLLIFSPVRLCSNPRQNRRGRLRRRLAVGSLGRGEMAAASPPPPGGARWQQAGAGAMRRCCGVKASDGARFHGAETGAPRRCLE